MFRVQALLADQRDGAHFIAGGAVNDSVQPGGVSGIEARDRSPGTVETYSRQLNGHVLPALGALRLGRSRRRWWIGL